MRIEHKVIRRDPWSKPNEKDKGIFFKHDLEWSEQDETAMLDKEAALGWEFVSAAMGGDTHSGRFEIRYYFRRRVETESAFR